MCAVAMGAAAAAFIVHANDQSTAPQKVSAPVSVAATADQADAASAAAEAAAAASDAEAAANAGNGVQPSRADMAEIMSPDTTWYVLASKVQACVKLTILERTNDIEEVLRRVEALNGPQTVTHPDDNRVVLSCSIANPDACMAFVRGKANCEASLARIQTP